MFSLDTFAQTVPALRVGGRFGVEVLALLWPIHGDGGTQDVRLCAVSELQGSLDLEELFQRFSLSQISLGALRAHVLVIRPSGEFFSTDTISLLQIRRDKDQLSIDLQITHYQNPNLDPAPRDLYVFLHLDVEDHLLQSLILRFSGRWRDSQGSETAMPEPVAPPQLIEFSE